MGAKRLEARLQCRTEVPVLLRVEVHVHPGDRAGDRQCGGIDGTGTDSSRGLKWGPGPWTGWGKHKRAGQRQPALDMPRFGTWLMIQLSFTELKAAHFQHAVN